MFKSMHRLVLIMVYLIRIINNELIVKPAETIILRDQYKPFIALCTGQRNTRVVSWQSPSAIEIKENNHERITVERRSSGLRLRIRNLTEDDQGIWKCLGLNENGQSISQNFGINVKMPIIFFSELIQYAELNSTVLIKCRVNANPSAEISWFKGSDKVEINSPNYEQRSDGLRINRVSSNDNDTFWCRADVIDTGETKDFQIQVFVAQPISSTRVTCLTPCAVEKRSATLICEANGMPTPEYSWSYGQNSPFIVDGISKFVVRGNRLIINHVDETDNGQYICHAFNGYDKNGQKKDYLLNVIIPPVLSPIPKREISIDENSPARSVSFSCHLQRGSIENLSLQWFYANNTLVQPTNEISIDNSQRSSELIFNSVRRTHHGNYTCSAKNSADMTSVVARLLIQYKPVYIGAEINNVYSVPNQHVIMKCEFDSYPTPILQWIKIRQEYDQIVLDETNPHVVEISNKQMGSTIYQTQLIYNPSEEDFDAKFECRADNSRIERHFLTLRLAPIPGQAHISRIAPNSNSMELTVIPPSAVSGLLLLEYIVKLGQIGVLNSTIINSYPVSFKGSQLILIENLRAGSLYRVEVAARSQAGQGPFSTVVQAQTLSGAVPQFSLSNNSCLSGTSCLVKWYLENDKDSSISKAEISYAKIGRNGKEEKWKTLHMSINTTEYELNRLKPKTNYSVVVRLYNKAGYAERKIQRTTKEAASSNISFQMKHRTMKR